MDPLTFDLEAASPPACGTTRTTLKRFFVRELPAADLTRIEAHAKDCLDCQAVLAELRSDEAAFKVHIPFAKFVAAHEKRLAHSQPVKIGVQQLWKWLLGGGGALAFAAAGAFLLLPSGTPEQQMQERIKGGGLGFLLKTPEGVRTGKEGEQLKAGDQIQFYVKGPTQEAELIVLGVDGKGEVTIYHAGPAPEGSEGRAAPLHDSVVLDDAVGPERFFAVYADHIRPMELRAAVQKAAEKVASGGTDLKGVESLPLDLPVKQSSVLIVKVAR
jgi:hypothetical protein